MLKSQAEAHTIGHEAPLALSILTTVPPHRLALCFSCPHLLNPGGTTAGLCDMMLRAGFGDSTRTSTLIIPLPTKPPLQP